MNKGKIIAVSYTHLRAHETADYSRRNRPRERGRYNACGFGRYPKLGCHHRI